MKLSKLVFLCVKNVIYLNDTNFDYDAFLAQNFDNDPDYDTNINNVFSPLNEAIARLSDLERIPYKVVEVKCDYMTKEINLNNIDGNQTSINVKELNAVGQMIGGKPRFLRSKHVGNKVLILDYIDIRYPIYLEYKEEIPYFSRDDIPAKDPLTGVATVDSNGFLTPDFDLKDFNINDSMCNYLIEYVQGKLEEQIEPSLANMHVTRAETYFSNMRTVRPMFLPQFRASFKIGE